MHFEVRENSNVSILELGEKSRFRDLLDPLEADRDEELGKSIAKVSINIPVVAWFDSKEWWLVDGHHRRKHWLNAYADNRSLAEPPVYELKCKTEDEVCQWIEATHLNRRNLTDKKKKYLIGKLYNESKQTHGGNRKNKAKTDEKSSGHDDHLKTEEVIAADHGVSPKTARRAGDFAKGVDELPEDEREKVLAGESELTDAEVEGIGRGEKPKAHTNGKANGKPKAEPQKLDPSKRPIPKGMEDIFATCKDFNRISGLLSEVLREVKAFVPGSDQPRASGWEHFGFQQFEAAIAQAKAELKFAAPFTTCVKGIHKGPDCPKCRGTGFLVRDTIRRLSDLDKQCLPPEEK